MSTVEREVIAREETRELKERVVEINRVAKVVKGGRRFSFTALVVIGDEVDRVGVGYGKAREVPLAISKAVDDAKKNLFTVPKHGTTITHEILGRFDAATVFLRPASPRERASSPAAACARCSSSPASATCSRRASARRTRSTWRRRPSTALQNLRRPEDVARMRGKTVAEILPLSSARSRRAPRRAGRRARRDAGGCRRRRRAAEDGP